LSDVHLQPEPRALSKQAQPADSISAVVLLLTLVSRARNDPSTSTGRINMIKKFMQGFVRAELEEQQSANLKTVIWIYGAIGTAAGIVGIGAAIKGFIDRVGALERKMELLDRVIVEEEQREARERELAQAYQLLGNIERAKSLTAAHEAMEKERATELAALRELTRQRMARQAQ